MAHARPFWTSTLQDLSNETKNTQMQGDLTPEIELRVFGSPGGLHFPTFESVGFTLTLSPKWGCDTSLQMEFKILIMGRNGIMMQIASSHIDNLEKMKEGNCCSHKGIIMLKSLGFKF
jgi:hypothetical protein